MTRISLVSSVKQMLMPYAWRALWVWMSCSMVAAALYRSVRRIAIWRLVVNGLGATLVGLVAGGTIDSGSGAVALMVPMLLFGATGAAITFWRSRSMPDAGLVLAAWALAALVPLLAVRPIG